MPSTAPSLASLPNYPGSIGIDGHADPRMAPDLDQYCHFSFVHIGSAPLGSLRDMARKQMEANAQMNAMMNETLNIGGALLVKLFGRRQLEVERFGERASQVRDLGVQRAVTGSIFMSIIGLISAVGTALVYGLGGYFVIRGAFTIGTIVAFGAYLGSLYNALQGFSNAPVEFATSMVSFERVSK